MALHQRMPTAAEQAVIDRARSLMANRPAEAFALLDGGAVLYSDTKAAANAESVLLGGYSYFTWTDNSNAPNTAGASGWRRTGIK